MQNVNVKWDFGIFFHAFTYSSSVLLFSITIVIASVLCIWLYEKPLLFKLMFKKSHSDHCNELRVTHSQQLQFSLLDDEISNAISPKKITELSVNTLEYEKVSDIVNS